MQNEMQNTPKNRMENRQRTLREEIKNHHQQDEKQEAVRLRPEFTFTLGEATKPEKAFSGDADDDETRIAEGESAEAVFLARLRGRHNGSVDAERLMEHVKAELEKGQIDLIEFLDADLKATTGQLKNPHGHYRKLAQNMVRERRAKTQAVLLNSQLAARQVVQDDHFRPASCCNDGLLDGGGFCSCKVGEARRQFTEYQAKRAKVAS